MLMLLMQTISGDEASSARLGASVEGRTSQGGGGRCHGQDGADQGEYLYQHYHVTPVMGKSQMRLGFKLRLEHFGSDSAA